MSVEEIHAATAAFGLGKEAYRAAVAQLLALDEAEKRRNPARYLDTIVEVLLRLQDYDFPLLDGPTSTAVRGEATRWLGADDPVTASTALTVLQELGDGLGSVQHEAAEARTIHARWVLRRNRRTEVAGYRDDWYGEQCGACRWWVPLSGVLGGDYGACANAASPFDARVMFEHDGCEQFVPSGDWATP